MGIFKDALTTQSDIWMHLGLLHGLACDPDIKHIFEIGVRTGLSTAALCASKKTVTSVDIGPCEPDATVMRVAYPNWTFVQEHSLKVELPDNGYSIDMLFIDGEHTYRAVSAELEKYAPNVSKWIVLHDTETFAHKGKDGSADGLMDAIQEFILPGTWRVMLHLRHNNGLTILERA